MSGFLECLKVNSSAKLKRILKPSNTLLDPHTLLNFNCCLSVHVDNYTIIIPTKCTRFLLLKAQDITICTFLSCIIAPTCFNPRGSSSGRSMPVPKVIIDYNLLKLR
jgi:hypothetical protein